MTVDLGLPGRVSGKVRESWPLPNDRRLLVTTDRLSAFDHIIHAVPHKGQVLNQLSAWWFGQTSDIVANHLIEVPDPNAVIGVDARPLPVEVIVRARLTGSTSTAVLPRYQAGEREIYGYTLPDGLEAHGPLPRYIITPTTKAVTGTGHDTPITCDQVVEQGLVEESTWEQVQEAALALFARGVEQADAAGFVLADTKYEFGTGPDGQLLLIDEIHTPDSSRYWAAHTLDDRLAAGQPPDGYDKEPVRLALKAAGFEDGKIPELDEAVWVETSNRYVHLYERLTGCRFEPGEQPVEARLRRNLASLLADTATQKSATQKSVNQESASQECL